VLYSEIIRGAYPSSDNLAMTIDPTWGADGPSNPNTQTPPAACQTPTSPALTYNITGLEYVNGTLYQSLYTHTVPPNSKTYDCINFIFFDAEHLAARSRHSGGVNSAMADGSVRFMKDTIELSVWKALGTRRGAEVLDQSSY
jgi:prepilin-type processing-associated H-X9-DG protein